MKKITILCNLFVIAVGYAQPTVNAPVPTRLQANVISVYSNSYTKVATNYNPDWGQSGLATTNENFLPTGSGTNTCLAYTNFNYQGTNLGEGNPVVGQNASTMEFLHVDVWSNSNPTNTILQVSPINGGTGATGTLEKLVTINHVQNQWYSVDIPKASFTGQTWNAIHQLKFAANGAGSTAPADFYIDNVYFWKAPTATGAPDYGTFTIPSKNVGDATFAITAPTSTSPAPFTYSSGNTAVATVSGNIITIIGAGVAVITASQVASSPYIAGSTTTNFVVNDIPIVAAPTPPARAVADVISLFSDAYANISVENWNQAPIWYAPTGRAVADLNIAGNPTKKIEFAGDGFIGVVLSAYNNATAMTHFHMDYWIPNATVLTGKVLIPKWSNHPGMSGEVNALKLTHEPAIKGSWASLDVALATFVADGPTPSLNRGALKEFLITSNMGDVFIDNIYLHKNTTLANVSFEKSNIKMFPNPTSDLLTFQNDNVIEKVVIYNLLGQEVMSSKANQNVVSVNVSSLAKGVYVAQTTVNGVESMGRFIKN